MTGEHDFPDMVMVPLLYQVAWPFLKDKWRSIRIYKYRARTSDLSIHTETVCLKVCKGLSVSVLVRLNEVNG